MSGLRYALFVLTPFFYSIDNDPYRAYEVVLVAAVFSLLFLRARMGSVAGFDIGIILAYGLVLMVQQVFIQNGDFLFGLRFFIATTCAYLPFWMLRSTHWYVADIMTPLRRGVDAVFYITIASVYSSFVFGIGEWYVGGYLGHRAFGYLGDSFTPVIVFLILFYAFERRWTFAGLAFVALLMTGGKSGIAMLAAASGLFVLVVAKSVLVRHFAGLAVIGLLFLPVGLEDAAQNIRNVQFSLNNRLFSIQVGWEYFRDNPIFGIGINQGLGVVGLDADRLARSLGITQYFPVHQIHNAYVRALAETGLVGFGLLVLLVAYWIKGATRALRLSRDLDRSPERSFLAAGGLWVICFVLGYQTTGWFLVGHPQLAWLLMFSTCTTILHDRIAFKRRGASFSHLDHNLRQDLRTPEQRQNVRTQVP